MNTCTAQSYYESKHGKDTPFLSKQAICDMMEEYAQKFYAFKLKQFSSSLINDTYSELRTPFPPNSTDTPISEQP